MNGLCAADTPQEFYVRQSKAVVLQILSTEEHQSRIPPCVADSTNAALATAAGLDVPAVLGALSSLSSQVASGQSAATEAQNNIQGTGIVVGLPQ